MTYDLFLDRDYLTFSCAHFVIGEHFHEALHGHNYNILVNVYGTQGKDNMVINFHEIKRILKPLVDTIDHHILIPTKNRFVNLIEKGEQLVLQVPHIGKEYEFPKSDVVMLPIENTTVEEMSHYFVKMLAKNKEMKQGNISQVTVTIYEYEGQGVTTELFPVHH